MSNLTELEQDADREARHGHRELVERLEEEKRELALQVIASQGQADEALGRVAELEAGLIDAEKSLDAWEPDPKPCTNRIRTLLRNEGGSDDQ